jgi:hypothetical protein
MLRSMLVAIASCNLLACSSSGDGTGSAAELSSCGLRTSLGGAVSASFTGHDDVACLTQHSFDSGLDVDFVQPSSKITVTVTLEDVVEGETGEQYPAQVRVTSDAGTWQTDACAMSLSEHRLLRTEASMIGELRHYQVSGRGSCSEPLHATSGLADTSVAELEFRAQFTWRD